MAKSQMFVVDHHPAIPPADLLKAWEDKWFDEEEHADVLLIKAFQAGADQELEACCEWLEQKVLLQHQHDVVLSLRAARRPKPPSLKEQALRGLDGLAARLEEAKLPADLTALYRALEQLDD